jgi:iron complex transport system substrate-binding protein
MRATVLSLVVIVAACTAGRERAPGAVRVVSLHDVTTELVVELGAAGRLVGVAEPVDVSPTVERAIAGVPRVAGLESIVAVHPDVVLGTGVIAERDPELVARLRERGIDVVIPALERVDDTYALAAVVAQRTGTSSAALLARLHARLDRAPSAVVRRPRVFVFDCCDPPFTAGAHTVMNDLIARAGGENVFADVDAAWTHVSWEAVIARRPELVIVDAYREDGQGEVDDKLRALRALPSLASVPVVVIPLGEALGGPRSADAIDRLRAAIGGSS